MKLILQLSSDTLHICSSASSAFNKFMILRSLPTNIPALIAQFEEGQLWGMEGPGFSPQPGHTKVELRQDKTNKMNVRPVKTQMSPGIRPVWS